MIEMIVLKQCMTKINIFESFGTKMINVNILKFVWLIWDKEGGNINLHSKTFEVVSIKILNS